MFIETRGIRIYVKTVLHNVSGVGPKFELGKVDIFKLAEGLKKENQQEQHQKKPELDLKENLRIQPVKLG